MYTTIWMSSLAIKIICSTSNKFENVFMETSATFIVFFKMWSNRVGVATRANKQSRLNIILSWRNHHQVVDCYIHRVHLKGTFFFFFLIKSNKILNKILAGYTFVVWHPAAYSYLLFSIRRSSTKDRSGFYSFWWTFPLIFSIREPFMMR